MRDKDIVLSSIRMDLSSELKELVHGKLEKLLRHEERIIRINVELEHDSTKKKEGEYIAKGHIEISGPPMIVSCATEDIGKSIDQMVDKLDRKIRRRSRLDRVKRKAVHDVDIPAQLPKVASA